MEKITYGALKKPLLRKKMLGNEITSLGTQAGNYGIFTEDARILTIKGANKIKSELEFLCKNEGLDLGTVLEFAPVLTELTR